MKKITAYKIIFTLLCLFLGFFSLKNNVSAEEFVTQVSGFIDIDPYSTVEIDNENTEVGLWRNVRVRITDRNSNPLSGHSVSIYSDTSEEVEFVQPPVTDSDGYAVGKVRYFSPGVYTVKAKDTTYDEDILIQVSADVYVFPIPSPVFKPEPYYTKGSSNLVEWLEVDGLDTVYEYQVQVSNKSDFSTVVQTSPLLDGLSYTFTNLTNSQMYFYRVRSLNTGGEYSEWSDSVFSVQDATPPVIVATELPDLEKVGGSYQVVFKFNVTDNLTLQSVSLYCQNTGGLEECGTLQSTGSSYTALISLDELEKGLFQNFRDRYVFCVEASDQAGNMAQNCEFEIHLKEYTDIDIPIFTEVINYVFKNTNSLLNDFDSLITGYLVSIKAIYLTIIGIILLFLSVILSIYVLFGGLSLVPMAVAYFFSRIWKFIGLIKPGAPCGIVYDGESKKPIRFALVSIYNHNNSLIRRDITDGKGRFTGNFDTGRYRIIVSRKGYLFPSIIVKKDVDEKYERVYRGNVVIVSKRNPMNISIPIDPMDMMSKEVKSERAKLKAIHLIKYLNLLVTLLGLVVAIHTFERSTNLFNLILLLFYIPAFGFYMKAVIRLNIGMK
ncbi:fibronectin type III domain-containing protein [Candidatus Dojkabacteria bacterium]|nr:fibronectin type III domain-containing protein [Candidatus Dojkabacteria bacterium]